MTDKSPHSSMRLEELLEIKKHRAAYYQEIMDRPAKTAEAKVWRKSMSDFWADLNYWIEQKREEATRPPTYGSVKSRNVHGDLVETPPTFIQVNPHVQPAPSALDDRGRAWYEYEDDVWCHPGTGPYWLIFLGKPKVSK